MTVGRPRTEREHGLYGLYRRGCRCVMCRMSAAFRRGGQEEQSGRHRRVKREPQPEKTALWKRAVELDAAGQLADHIIRTRPIPERLIAALARAPVVSERYIQRTQGQAGHHIPMPND